MGTEIDWRGELDRAIEHGADRPVADYVTSGHRAVRRRRAAASAACLVSTLVAGGLGWTVLADQGRSSTESRIAGQGPSRTESTESSVGWHWTTPLDPTWSADEPPARLHPDGGIEVRYAASVLQHHDYVDPGGSTEFAALDVRYDGQRWWILLDWDGASGGVIHAAPDQDDEPDRVPEELASWTSAGLRLRDGVTLESRVDNPFGLEPPETSVGLAFEHEGTTTWVIATAGPDGSSTSSVNAADSGWLTFDQWLDEQVAGRGSGPGLRLVTMDDDGTLTPTEPGVEVVDEEVEPVLSSYPDAAPTPGTVGMLTWDGGTWFVHVTRSQDQEDVRTFAAAKVGGADSLAEFVDHLRRRSPDGGGIP